MDILKTLGAAKTLADDIDTALQEAIDAIEQLRVANDKLTERVSELEDELKEAQEQASERSELIDRFYPETD